MEDCLNKGLNFKTTAMVIGKDPTTVSYEVKHHRMEYRNSLTKSDQPCPILLKPPYVCNGCERRHRCPYVHYYYRAKKADQEYRTTLSESREGIPLNKAEFYENDRILSEGLKKGQHIYHIMQNSPITCSKSTVYRHFSKGYYSASLVALPRAVKFKTRKKDPAGYVPSGVKVGRSYEDFLAYTEENQIDSHTELDTVIGRVGGKVILTIHFVLANFMVGLLLDNKSAAEAASHFRSLKDTLRNAGFSIRDVMRVLLTDNGGEFSDVFSFENAPDGSREIPLFFCHPMRSSEKPFIEKNHSLFRDIVPKGSSFDDFSQSTVNLIFSHVNSVSRPLFHGKSAYDMFSFLYGDQLAELMGVRKISPDLVVQSPLLLKGIDLKKNC